MSADELGCIGVNISGRWLSNLRFADCMVLIATSPQTLVQRQLDEVDCISTEFCLQISTKDKGYACYKEKETLHITCQPYWNKLISLNN